MDGFPDTPQTPKAPVMTRAKVAGYEGCELKADIYSTDNHIMPSNALYYKIYADGKLLGDKELIFMKDNGNNFDDPFSYYWFHPDREIYTDSYLFREVSEVNAWLTYFGRSDGTPGLRKILYHFLLIAQQQNIRIPDMAAVMIPYVRITVPSMRLLC